MHFGIVYRVNVNLAIYKLVKYVNSNYKGDCKDRKYVIDYCFFIIRAVVWWYSKKQQIISTSTIETEYITLSYVERESI